MSLEIILAFFLHDSWSLLLTASSRMVDACEALTTVQVWKCQNAEIQEFNLKLAKKGTSDIFFKCFILSFHVYFLLIFHPSIISLILISFKLIYIMKLFHFFLFFFKYKFFLLINFNFLIIDVRVWSANWFLCFLLISFQSKCYKLSSSFLYRFHVVMYITLLVEIGSLSLFIGFLRVPSRNCSKRKEDHKIFFWRI